MTVFQRIGVSLGVLATLLVVPPVEAQAKTDTIQGVVVVRNGSGLWESGEHWTLTEQFRLGSGDGSSEELFSNFLTAVTLGPREHLYVLDLMSHEIRLFDPQSQYRLTFGGPGGGPGELRDPVALGWDASDHLWVRHFDGRFTVYDSVGGLVKTTPLQGPSALDHRLYRLHFNDDGSFVDHAAVDGGVQLLRRDTTATIVENLALLERPYDAPEILAFQVSQEVRDALRKFRPELVWTVGIDGTVWVGRSDELRLVQLTFGGDTLRIVETGHREPRFSAREKRLVALAQRELEQDVLLSPVVLQSLHVLEEGHVLAQIAGELDEPGKRFDVFDPEGRFLGTMTWPFAPHPGAVHSFDEDVVVAVTLGDFDVPYVVKARLNRSGGS